MRLKQFLLEAKLMALLCMQTGRVKQIQKSNIRLKIQNLEGLQQNVSLLNGST